MNPVARTALDGTRVSRREGTVGVHGVVYDVSRFRHPGGEVWLKLCSGLDVTELFESSHLKSYRARHALSRLPVVGTCLAPTYDFDTYARFRARALRTFGSRKTLPFHGYLRVCAWLLLSLSSLRVLLLGGGGGGWWLAVLAHACANTVLGGFGHNAVHRLHPFCVFLDWNGLSCFEWLSEHAISHHPHVNTPRDHDAMSMEPFLRWIPWRKGGWLGDAQSSPWRHGVYAISEPIVALLGSCVHCTRWKACRFGAPWWMAAAPLLFVARVCVHVWAGALVSLLASLSLSGYFFAFLAHKSHAEVHPPSSDFLTQQVRNTTDLDPPTTWTPPDVLLFLDRQRLHHLLPTVDHLRLREVGSPPPHSPRIRVRAGKGRAHP